MNPATSPLPAPIGHPALSRSGPIVDDRPSPASTNSSPIAAPRVGRRQITVLVLDRSGSMHDPWGEMTKLQGAKRAALGVLSNIFRANPDAEVLIVVFDSRAHVVHPLCVVESAYDSLIAAVKGIQVRGNTDLGAAMELVERSLQGVLGHDDTKVMVLLMTDGKGGEPRPAAERLKAAGALVAVNAFGTTKADVNESLLHACASVVDGKRLYDFADSAEQLATRTKSFSKTMRRGI